MSVRSLSVVYNQMSKIGTAKMVNRSYISHYVGSTHNGAT